MNTASLLVRVALPVPGKGDGVFQYSVPEGLVPAAVPGAAVVVPLGRRRVDGFIVGFDDEPFPGVRPLLAVQEHPPVLPHLLDLAAWMSRRYLSTLHSALRLMSPPAAGGGLMVVAAGDSEATVDAIVAYGFPAGVETQLVELIPAWTSSGVGMSDCLKALDGPARLAFRTILRDGVLAAERHASRNSEIRQPEVYTPLSELSNEAVQRLLTSRHITARQAEVMSGLLGKRPGTVASLARSSACSPSVVHALIDAGLLVRSSHGEATESPEAAASLEAPLSPNHEQALAIRDITAAIEKGTYDGFLLHGVTGSGKTEVYLQCIQTVMAKNRQAILIVPEIALTPQLLHRVRSRFGPAVALLHSNLPEGRRRTEWYRIARGEARVVLGARSALFAPVSRPGLVILDEEHETSFKQEESPRYHAREVAEQIARSRNAVLVLGSATPAIETFYRSEQGGLKRIGLAARVGARPLPETTVVDMRDELKNGNRSVFSRTLQGAIEATLARHEQVILFLNRRGYSTFVLCRECGHVMKCPHCDVSLTYHSSGVRMRCHYCGHEQTPPEICPKCGSRAIRYFGAGTQRIEEEIRGLYPAARVARMDVDTTSRKGSHDRIYQALADERIDILIGTQMVAKGLDLPGVTLVGIISADTSLNLPDFRAGERTFQLITQVSGRAGRGDRPGLVVMQTYNPGHYSVRTGASQDYGGFYENELAERQIVWYPPFCNLVKISAAGPNARLVSSLLEEWAGEFRHLAGPEGAVPVVNAAPVGQFRYELLGPAPAPVGRVQNRHRFQIVVKGAPEDRLLQLIEQVQQRVKPAGRGITMAVDVNPYSIV